MWGSIRDMTTVHQKNAELLARLSVQMESVLEHFKWDRDQKAVNNRWKLAQIIFIGTPILTDALVHLIK